MSIVNTIEVAVDRGLHLGYNIMIRDLERLRAIEDPRSVALDALIERYKVALLNLEIPDNV